MKFFLVASLVFAASAANLPSQPIPGLPLQDQVGVGRIVGGEEAVDGEFPWMVSLRTIAALGATHFCGGAIIDKDWILTGAWCCSISEISGTKMHVVAGGIKIFNNEHEEELRNVDQFISHPNYVVGHVNLGNDVCLLKLTKSLEWTEFVQPIALPAAGQETAAGTKCTVTGWGAINGQDQSHYNILHKMTVPVISDEDCDASSIASGWDVVDSMICSEDGYKDTCGGDDGGPFFCGEQGNEELVGIVSWIGCHGKGYPDVYTEVAYFVDWIMETMATY